MWDIFRFYSFFSAIPMSKSSPFAYLADVAENTEKGIEHTIECKGNSYTLSELIQALKQIAETESSDTPIFSVEFGAISRVSAITIEENRIVFTK